MRDGRSPSDEPDINNDGNEYWKLLPLDIQKYIMTLTDRSSLFAVSRVSKTMNTMVKRYLTGMPAPQLLRLLPLWDGINSGDEAYRAARREMLGFNLLLQSIEMDKGFQKFNTMEEGILALITVPREQLNSDDVLKLVFGPGGNDANIESEGQSEIAKFISSHLQTEIKKLGEDRVKELVSQLKTRNSRSPDPEESQLNVRDDQYLKVMAVMILRASKDEVIHKHLVELHCTPWSKLVEPLSRLYQYANENNNQRILEIIAWLIEVKIEDIQPALNKMMGTPQKAHKTFILHKLDYLLAQPGCLDLPIPLEKDSSEIRQALLGRYSSSHNDISYNYTLWSCALLFGSFKKADHLWQTIFMQVCLSNDKKYSGQRHYVSIRNGDSPSFSNFRLSHVNPYLLQHRHEFYCDDFSEATFGAIAGGPFSIYKELLFESCLMNKAVLSDLNFQYCSFVKMKIDGLLCQRAKLDHCHFNDCTLTNSLFDKTAMMACTFSNCDFGVNVSFKDCLFEKYQGNPIIFTSCQLDASLLPKNIKNVIFINCEFQNKEKLPKGIKCFTTNHKDMNSIEGLYETFKILVQANADEQIKALQKSLMEILSNAHAQNKKEINPLQDRMCREIFGHNFTFLQSISATIKGAQPNILLRYIGLNLSVTPESTLGPK